MLDYTNEVSIYQNTENISYSRLSQTWKTAKTRKSGKNVKKFGISKFAHNSLKLLLFQIIVIIF